MTRISALLGKAELAALLDMATADCRRLREQMRYLLREEAKRRGLLPAEPPPAGANRAPSKPRG